MRAVVRVAAVYAEGIISREQHASKPVMLRLFEDLSAGEACAGAIDTESLSDVRPPMFVIV